MPCCMHQVFKLSSFQFLSFRENSTPISENDYRSHSLLSFGYVLCPLSGIVLLSSMPHSQGDKCFAFLTRSLSESHRGNQQSLCYFLSRKTNFSVAVHDRHCQCDALLRSTFRISLNCAPLSGHHYCGRGSRVDSIVH